MECEWTVYHSNKNKGIDYDYGLVVNFREISISPEQIKERNFIRKTDQRRQSTS
jgi:hypothetical protein